MAIAGMLHRQRQKRWRKVQCVDHGMKRPGFADATECRRNLAMGDRARQLYVRPCSAARLYRPIDVVGLGMPARQAQAVARGLLGDMPSQVGLVSASTGH